MKVQRKEGKKKQIDKGKTFTQPTTPNEDYNITTL